MTWRRDSLPELMTHLARSPGHEHVRADIIDILRNGFQARLDDIDHEVRMPEVRGRADTLFGATVFEFKSDLRHEIVDVRNKMPDYLGERERKTGRRFLGIATDGATFIAFELRDGSLKELGRHEVSADRPDGDALLAWLSPALADRDDLDPEPLAVQRALGRESFAFKHANEELARLWSVWRADPEVSLKRQLWDGLLREAYGTEVGDDRLFLQHTYLTIVAKTIAARVLHLETNDASSILSGRLLAEAGILGAVESDFFDWVLKDRAGVDLVLRLSRQASRFRLRDVESDVLKALYESLIDPDQRHDLGEYYTPDWLAAKVTAAAMTDPLRQRVLDPACGSGTFLFHAIRQLLAAAEAAGWSSERRVAACALHIRGLDIHPVAVIIARVTWLLALGSAIHERKSDLFVPVFLGDAMQWNVNTVADLREVQVAVPGESPLIVPAGFAEQQVAFDQGLQALKQGLDESATVADMRRSLGRIGGVASRDADVLSRTYARLVRLKEAGRNHIWPFILGNLMRPLWLSRDDQRADVLIGNPPWVAYRHLSGELQPRLREACQALDIWVGGRLATQQDLSALFWARCAQRYLRVGGTIAFVLPYAALNRPAFNGLRQGRFMRNVEVRIDSAWSFDEHVRPLFPVPACVLFGTRASATQLPASVTRYSGALPRRDANEAEADKFLQKVTDRWPPIPTLTGRSPYRAKFKQGATIVPRRFFIVTHESSGRLGASRAAPRVRGKTGAQDKRPWRNVDPPSGPVESDFLRPVLLGENIAPYRVLKPALGVIPMIGGRLLDSAGAAAEGYRNLASWLRDIEGKWLANCNKRANGAPMMTLLQQIDHMHKLSGQAGVAGPRIVYAASGTLPAALIIDEPEPVVEHSTYWARTRSIREGRYLAAILNSETVRLRVEGLQPKGQGGPRHFDNLVWELNIPDFSSKIPLHTKLAAAAAVAENVAAAAELSENAYFTTNRRVIRDALAANGIGQRIDALVAQLLDG